MKVTPLITKEEIESRIKQLAEEINDYYGSKKVTVLSVLKGAFLFTADLLKLLKFEVTLEFVRVASYRGVSKGKTELLFFPEENIEGKNILIVDDILDTGETLELILKRVRQLKPQEVKVCVFLLKEVKRKVNLNPDFVGFKVPDKFVVGYGLDYNEHFRNLPYVGYLTKTPQEV